MQSESSFVSKPHSAGPRHAAIRRRASTLRAASCAATGLVALALGVAACSSTSSHSTSPTTLPPPEGLPSFYSTPKTYSHTPGTLVKYERVPASGVDGTAYRVMYVSRSEQEKPELVTGLVYVPNTTPPAGGFPVVSWAHGTNGMAPQCAPSLDASNAVPSINALLNAGWEVTASDYQGEGTAGLLPYLVGNVAAQNTIDIVKAVGNLAVAHASADYVVWGHSEGGQTAMFTWDIGRSYGTGLQLKGVVAGAPPSQFAYIYSFLKTSRYRYYVLMAAVGMNEAYGSAAAPLNEVASPLAMKLLPILSKGCYNYVANHADRYTMAQLVPKDPFTVPAWHKIIMANDPENFATPTGVPLLLIQGTKDKQIPVISTQFLAQHLCKIGAGVQRWLYPGMSHTGVIAPSTPDMVQWIKDRFANQPVPDPYKPHGMAGVMAMDCQTGFPQ